MQYDNSETLSKSGNPSVLILPIIANYYNTYPAPTLYQSSQTNLPPYPYHYTDVYDTAVNSKTDQENAQYSPIPKPNLFYSNPTTSNEAYSANNYEALKQNN